MSGVCIVTGGSRGIGAACARQAANAGYDVCFSYLSNETAANDTVAEIVKQGGKAEAVKADASSEPDVLRLFEAAERMGPIKALWDIDIIASLSGQFVRPMPLDHDGPVGPGGP